MWINRPGRSRWRLPDHGSPSIGVFAPAHALSHCGQLPNRFFMESVLLQCFYMWELPAGTP